MDKTSLPQWAWLLVGLFAAAILGQFIGIYLMVSPDWQIVVTISLMSLVVIYVGIWHDEERSSYWEHPRSKMVGDVLFTVLGAGLGGSIALLVVFEIGISGFVADLIAMVTGLLLAWALFWWRNTDLYRNE